MNTRNKNDAGRDGAVSKNSGHTVQIGSIVDDPRWSALASGTLPEEEIAALRELAEQSEEARACFEAFQPLTIDVWAKVTARQRQEAPESQKRETPFVPRRRFRALAPLFAAAVIAAAAAVPLALWSRGGGEIPPYMVETLGGEKATRSDSPPRTARDEPDGEMLVLAPGAHFRITLRPATRVGQDVEMRAFLSREGRAERWNPPREINGQNGIFMISGIREALFPGVGPGEFDLIFAIGRSGALPADDVLTSAGAKGPAADDNTVQVQRIRARLLSDPSGRETQ